MEIGDTCQASNDDFNEEESSSSKSDGARPRNFLGPSSTWRDLTKEERLIHMFMNRVKDQDLSLHLYNSQAMKVYYYSTKEGLELDHRSRKAYWQRQTDPKAGNREDFVLPKSWTAWPLSPDFVPRTREKIGAESTADMWAPNHLESQQHSLELEEILIALTLRLAKEKFRVRDRMSPVALEQPSHEKVTTDSGEDVSDANITTENRISKPGRKRQREVARQISQKAIREDAAERPDMALGLGYVVELPIDSQDQHRVLRPQIMTDDDKSATLLRPTIRHDLTLLENLLMALHEARKACMHYGSENPQSEPDVDSDGIAVSQTDELKNVRSLLDTSSRSGILSHEQTSKQAGTSRVGSGLLVSLASTDRGPEKGRSKNSRSQKRKLRDPVKVESQPELLQVIAGSIVSENSSPTKSSFERPMKRGNSTKAREIRSKRLGLRDWSEILGAAALVGLSPHVIARATQRCATLFGEGMEILSLADSPPLEGRRDQITQYLPDYRLTVASSNPDWSDSEQLKIERTSSKRSIRKKRHSKAKSEKDFPDFEELKPPVAGFDRIYCPWPNCVRLNQSFTSEKYLERHLNTAHKLKASQIKNLLSSGSGETVSGVHIDGFLKEIVRRQGWRGTDGEPRQRAATGRYAKKEQLTMGSNGSPLSSSREGDLS